jgi:hypothetical protein
MGEGPARRLAPAQCEGVTIMDRFPAEVQVNVPITYAPGHKAALATSRAKAAVVIACVLLGAYFYAAEEKKNASASAAQALPREVQDLGMYFAPSNDDPTSMRIRQVFYDKRDGVYCGEVNGRGARGGELRLKDGVRIFVCGPRVADRAGPDPRRR